MGIEARLRWAIFTTSVVSAIDNPDALLWRALGTRLHQMGHQAIFYEPRGNEALRALLLRSGASALLQFRASFPDIEYRTFETRTGADLVEWMTRTLATADVALIQAGSSPDLVTWLGELTRPHLQTFYIDAGWSERKREGDRAAQQLTGFTSVVVGEAQRADEPVEFASGVRVLSFGPLPRIQQLDDFAATNPELGDACQRLIDVVIAAHRKATAERRAPHSPNGHRL